MMRKGLIYGLLILSLLLGSQVWKISAQNDSTGQEGFQLMSTRENGVTIEYRIGSYGFEKVELDGEIYDRIILAEANTFNDPAKPSLPLAATSIGVPIGAEFVLRIVEIQKETLPGTYWIEPSPSYVMGDQDLEAGSVVYVRDPETYARAEAFPGVVVELGKAAKLRDQRILPIRIYPFQYMPLTRTLEVIKSVRFEVEFRYPQGQPMPNLSQSEILAEENNPFEAIYQSSLLNYEEAKSFRAFEPAAELPMQGLSVESSPDRYKITVTEDGIYQLTYESLQAAGMAVTSVNPQTFSMTNQGRPVAIYVHNSDGNPAKFSPGEYVLFFGERFDGTYLASLYEDEDDFWRDSFYRPNETNLTYFPASFNRLMVEKYTNRNVYWLTHGGVAGPFMSQVNVSTGTAPFVESYLENLRFEEQNYWWTTHFTSEDTFFWERVQFSSSVQKDYPLNIPVPTGTGTATLRGEFVARVHNPSLNPDHRAILYINKNQNPNPIGMVEWDGLGRKTFEVSFPVSYLNDGSNTLSVAFQKVDGMTADDVYVNWFEITYPRRLIAQSNRIGINRGVSQSYASPSGTHRLYLPLILRESSPVSSLQITGFTQRPVVLSIADPLSPRLINGANYSSGVLSFQKSADLGLSFFIATPASVASIEQVSFQEIASPRADYIYIAPRQFLTQTQTLANYRQTKDGLTTKVVALEEIIDQFNFGIYHPRAIKNYLRQVYNTWSPKPVYVLLVGDGHWNFLGSSKYDNPTIYMPPNLQWVDPWQGEIDSSNALVTMDDQWDPLPDLFIGRLPVNSGDEITAYLNKVQTYEGAADKSWQKRFIFVADANDPGAGNFPLLLDNVIGQYPIADLRKIYLNKVGSTYTSYHTEVQNNLPCGSQIGSNACPNATQALKTLLNTGGAGHFVYSGHGYIDGWSKAVIFSNSDVNDLSNGANSPFVFSLDCLDGYWYYPEIQASDHRGQSLIEILVRTPNKGAVAAFSPTGLGLATAHDRLQRGFYDYIFSTDNWQLGEASVRAKLKVYQESPMHVDLVHTYTVFGDPALISPKP